MTARLSSERYSSRDAIHRDPVPWASPGEIGWLIGPQMGNGTEGLPAYSRTR